MKSKFFTVNNGDWIRGLFIAVIMAALASLYEVIESGAKLSEIDWNVILLAAIGGLVSYIIKNGLTNSDGEILKKERNPSRPTNP